MKRDDDAWSSEYDEVWGAQADSDRPVRISDPSLLDSSYDRRRVEEYNYNNYTKDTADQDEKPEENNVVMAYDPPVVDVAVKALDKLDNVNTEGTFNRPYLIVIASIFIMLLFLLMMVIINPAKFREIDDSPEQGWIACVTYDFPAGWHKSEDKIYIKHTENEEDTYSVAVYKKGDSYISSVDLTIEADSIEDKSFQEKYKSELKEAGYSIDNDSVKKVNDETMYLVEGTVSTDTFFEEEKETKLFKAVLADGYFDNSALELICTYSAKDQTTVIKDLSEIVNSINRTSYDDDYE